MAVGATSKGKAFGSFDGLRFVLDFAAVLGLTGFAHVGARGRGADVAVSVDRANEEVGEDGDQRDESDERRQHGCELRRRQRGQPVFKTR